MEVKLPYALKDGVLTHISKIPIHEKGLKCGCVCPHCSKKLIARLGPVNIHHFAHTSDCDPHSAIQTMLHYLAKEIVSKLGEFYLPKHVLKFADDGLEVEDFYTEDLAADSLPNDLYYQEGYFFKSRRKYGDEFLESVRGGVYKVNSVNVESRLSGIVPDIILNISGLEMIVEIAVTHFTDREKLMKIKELNIAALEIDLSDFYREWKNTQDFSGLEKIFTQHTSLLKWLHVPNDMIRIAQGIERRQFLVKESVERKAADHERRENQRSTQVLNISKDMSRAMTMYEPDNYQKLLEKHAQNINQNRFWNSMLKKYPIKKDIYPDIIDFPIRGEIMFGCDRKVWQGAIYFYLVYDKKGASCKFVDERMLQWMRESLYRELIYTPGLKDNGMPTHGDVIKTYFRYLMDNGCLQNDQMVHWNKYYQVL